MREPSLETLDELTSRGEHRLAVRAFEASWIRHWFQTEPFALRAFLSSLPTELVAESGAVHLVAVAVGAVGEPDRDLLYERALRRAQHSADDQELLLAHLLLVIHHRRDGDLRKARQQLELARPGLQRLESTLLPASRGLTSFARLQFAMTALLSGDLVAALAWTESGLDQAVSVQVPFMGRYLAAMMAVTSAVSGDMAGAHDWLARCHEAEPSGGWIDDVIDGAVHLARLVIATEEWRFDEAERLVRARNPASFGELWPVAFWAQTHYLMVRGRDAQGLRLAKQAMIAEPPGSRGDGMARDLLLGTRIEFLSALGRLRDAWGIGSHEGMRGPTETIATIGVLYRSGEFGTALFNARSLRGRWLLSVRQAVQVRALEAAAALAEGDRITAADSARALVELIEHHHLGSVVVHLPSELTYFIDEELGLPMPQVRVMAGLNVSPRLRAPLVAGPLSPREHAVLRQLVDARSRAAIAESLGVSVNTVKTQIQSIYRKFGVASQAELLKRLGELPPTWIEGHTSAAQGLALDA